MLVLFTLVNIIRTVFCTLIIDAQVWVTMATKISPRDMHGHVAYSSKIVWYGLGIVVPCKCYVLTVK